MPLSRDGKAAFRCRACGHLHVAAHAGVNHVPHACSVCGAGVRFGGDHDAFAAELRAAKTDAEIVAVLDRVARSGVEKKTLCPDNWEVLADATPERLVELGLFPEQVERHVPVEASFTDEPEYLAVHAAEGMVVTDKAG